MNIPNGKFESFLKKVNRLVLKYLIFMLSASLVMGAVHLTIIFVQKIIEPPFLILKVTSLLEIFSLVLVIVVGYELIESLTINILSESIPIIPIVQIALTAMANKVITMDIKKVDSAYLFGISAVILALSASLFLINFGRVKRKGGRSD